LGDIHAPAPSSVQVGEAKGHQNDVAPLKTGRLWHHQDFSRIQMLALSSAIKPNHPARFSNVAEEFAATQPALSHPTYQ
jgi:hypothetical protein